MMRTLARRAAAAAVPLITLPVLALAAASGTAQAAPPAATIQFHTQAQLQQPDGSILVTLDYSCNPAFVSPSGTLEVEAQQPAADGFNSTTPAICDDQKHTVTVHLLPGGFTPGTAAASALIFNGNTFAQTQAELKVS